MAHVGFRVLGLTPTVGCTIRLAFGGTLYYACVRVAKEEFPPIIQRCTLGPQSEASPDKKSKGQLCTSRQHP